MAKVAVLDEINRLVGYKTKKKPSATDIIVPEDCDLPADATYHWLPDEETFFPVGRGLGKPDRPPIPEHRALYLIANTLRDRMPQEVLDWLDWLYQTHQLLDFVYHRPE